MSNVLFLMMGGIGSRFGADIPKQFTTVAGKPLFGYILQAYDNFSPINQMVVVCNPSWVDYASKCMLSLDLSKKVMIVNGGKSRSASIRNGLESIKPWAKSDDFILIHDATHPYLDKNAVLEAIDLMEYYDGVTICQREYDTCYSIDGDEAKAEIPKKTVVSGASPEIFRYDVLNDIYVGKTDEFLERMSSAGAIALNSGLTLGVVSTKILNLKITHQNDMILFENLCSEYFFKE